MQTTFNLKSCMNVHLLNLMRSQAQIVAFGAILRHRGLCFLGQATARMHRNEPGRESTLLVKSICEDGYGSKLFKR
jgi:hypothetical protein